MTTITTETIQISEASVTVPQIPIPIIYIPLVYENNGGLCVLVLETHGRPLRYFEKTDDPLLKAFKSRCNPVVKDAGSIRVAEQFSWNVKYSVSNVAESWRIQRDGVRILPVAKLEDLLIQNPPLEFSQAFLQVTLHELSAV